MAPVVVARPLCPQKWARRAFHSHGEHPGDEDETSRSFSRERCGHDAWCRSGIKPKFVPCSRGARHIRHLRAALRKRDPAGGNETRRWQRAPGALRARSLWPTARDGANPRPQAREHAAPGRHFSTVDEAHRGSCDAPQDHPCRRVAGTRPAIALKRNRACRTCRYQMLAFSCEPQMAII